MIKTHTRFQTKTTHTGLPIGAARIRHSLYRWGTPWNASVTAKFSETAWHRRQQLHNYNLLISRLLYFLYSPSKQYSSESARHSYTKWSITELCLPFDSLILVKRALAIFRYLYLKLKLMRLYKQSVRVFWRCTRLIHKLASIIWQNKLLSWYLYEKGKSNQEVIYKPVNVDIEASTQLTAVILTGNCQLWLPIVSQRM